MICPHCHRTIEEQDQYLMSYERSGEPLRSDDWRFWALLFMVGFIIIAVVAQGKIDGLL